MSWAVGYDETWKRDVGYGVPCKCDHPDCDVDIDRGLAHVCGGQPFGGDDGCGLHFCASHIRLGCDVPHCCERCAESQTPFEPKPDVDEWIRHKLTCPTWKPWRDENPVAVEEMRSALAARAQSPDVGQEGGDA